MSVVVVLEGAGPGRFTVAVSPLAELAAGLHVLTGHGHHAEHAPWAREVARTAPAVFRAGLRRFSPLWTALRWRGFYTGLAGPTGPAGRPTPGSVPVGPTPPLPPLSSLAPLSRIPLDHFAELTAYSCASGYHGYAFDRVLRDPAQSAALRHAASGLPEPHLELAEALLRDPAALRADVLAFLDLCRPVFFGALWAETEPLLARAAHRVRQRLADDGPVAALAALSPSSVRLADPPRVVFDKVHHAVITPARTPVLLIPTRYGAPHLVVKNEPGLPPVLHFPVDAPVVGVTLARSRMLALTDPSRVRLCRLIARQSMTTADLADRLSMTRPQVSRHLRALRDLGLVRTERNGRYVHYGLDLDAVDRIGRDVATALQY
ncbi:ArsR/SmtB family transcription factor [Streptomyces niveus]|uniref:ArsR/SmtB family transcription factor n=1 Tax=Streptomyces niveus TaxID=193462 RepID=UPI00369C80DF